MAFEVEKMNENLKKLCMKSWNEYPNKVKFDPERFAELIINESIEVMKQHDYHGEWLGEKVKEHFGLPFNEIYKDDSDA